MELFDVYSRQHIEFARAEGLKLWDTKGKEYLDFYGGHAVISIGHTNPLQVAAITKQLNSIAYYSNSVRISQQEELAKKLGTIAECDDYKLFLCNSGAEANENALKLASFHNGRTKIISFFKSFHGRTSLAVSVTDNPKIVAPINRNANVQFVELNNLDEFEAAIDESVCAVIIEGVQGVGGINIPTPEFMQGVSAVCKKYGALLIVDEVQSGYGRTGKFFAHQHANISPDLITIAKGMGNGFPVAGVLIAPHIVPQMEMLGSTFGGNQLACTAAISVLDVIEQDNLISNAAMVGDYISNAVRSIDGVKEVRSLGLMIGIELHDNCSNVKSELLNRYGILTGSSSNKNTIRILPPLTISNVEAEFFVAAFSSTMDNNQ
ncbi:MAG: aspartate aminotransferase family protein [Ignavibacteria bacterium]|nr:aspartate aminotransferase family protein [Ignavibacteria bacterium]